MVNSLDIIYCRNYVIEVDMGRKQNALVVVAIDFGTTYSGYAYSFRDEYKKDHTKIYSNENWQSGDGLITAKAPTAILFDEDGKLDSFGYDAERTYSELLEGGDAEGYSYFSRFKMKLFQDESALQHPISRVSVKVIVSLITLLSVTILRFHCFPLLLYELI